MAGKPLLPPPPGACIIASFLKSGRTWLRFMTAVYLADLHGLGTKVDLHSLFTIVPNNDDDPRRGRAVYAHADRPDMRRVLCEHQIWRPFDAAVNPTVAMVRSPLDTVTSLYFMETRRQNRENMPLGAYLRGRSGMSRWIGYHNLLVRHRDGPGIAWISYEQLTAQPLETFGRVLDAFSIPRDPERMERAVAAAAFDRMAALEEEQGFPSDKTDPTDPQGRRMREGRIGAAARLVSDEDHRFVARLINETLDPAARGRLESLGCIL